MPVEQHQVRVLARLDAAHPVLQPHCAGPVDRHHLKRLPVGETVARQKRTVLAEVLEVLPRHVGLDAGVDTRVEQHLEQVDGLGIVEVLDDHHRADDGDDLRAREQVDHREDLFGVGERQPVDEAVIPRQPHHHHRLAGVVRVRVHHDVAADHRREGLQPLAVLGGRAPAGRVGFLPFHVLLRPTEVIVGGGVPPHHGLGRLARPQFDQRTHRHLEVDIGLEDHVGPGFALHLERHRLTARNDAAARASDHRGHTAGKRDLDRGIVEVQVLDRLPLGGDGPASPRPAHPAQREVCVGVDHPRDHDLRLVDARVGRCRDGRPHRNDDPVANQDLARCKGAVGDSVNRAAPDENRHVLRRCGPRCACEKGHDAQHRSGQCADGTRARPPGHASADHGRPAGSTRSTRSRNGPTSSSTTSSRCRSSRRNGPLCPAP